ncbi:MAG: DNA integrity scanning protein DisA nucleotide-binding domain protein [Planctomycetia bacterium]|nr:DNA integrity scanning protein DisA nucleotide-binding domain protein [Planctomycetia bacterium]
MNPLRASQEFLAIFDVAVRLADTVGVEAILLLLETRVEWRELQERSRGQRILLAADNEDLLEGAAVAGLPSVVLRDAANTPVSEKLSQALLNAVADELLPSGARVVALYGGFEPDSIDSISLIEMSDHLGRLTVRDLRQLETRVPLDTLQTVVNLALDIGREGREGKPVGTLFVVGDTHKVRKMSRSASFDPVKGYSRRERNLKLARVREGIKEIAQMDGAILVAPDGTVEAAAQYLDASAADVTLSKGLGARHWAAAAISRATKAVAVAVSESSGTVRVFQDGEVVLRIEPFRRPMKWKDFEPEGGDE